MGSIMGKTLEETFKKNNEFMINSQRTMLERQIQMQNYMREQQMAMQVARARDLVMWTSSGYTVLSLALINAFRRSKNPAILAPLIPLGFVVAYQADMAYGSKVHRMQDEAKRVIENESQLLNLPSGLPDIETLDQRRFSNSSSS